MMPEDDRRKIATQVAMGFRGLPYLWGGDDPMGGFDCSGMCIEVLKSVDLLPRKGDWTAAGLWQHFANNHGCAVPKTQVAEGCLVFWHSSSDAKRIIHIEYALNEELCIGASGGGSNTKKGAEYKLMPDNRIVPLTSEAERQNAYIKIRPISGRKGIYGVVDPFKLKYGGGYTSEPV